MEKLTLSGSLPQVLEGGPLNLKPLVHLEEVTLRGDKFLTRQELLDVFSALSPSTKLKSLVISHYPDEVPWQAEEEGDGSTEVLAKAVNFLESVTIQVYPYQVCIQIFISKRFYF